MELIMPLLKGSVVAGGAILAVKYADILAPLAGTVGAFFYMCGHPTGGLIVRFTLASYILIKIIGW